MTSPIDPSVACRRNDRTAWRAIGEVTVVIDLRANRMVGLNASGAFLWQCLAHPTTPAAVAAHLAAAGAVESAADAAAQIGGFFATLVAEGLAALATLAAVAPAAALPDAPEHFAPPSLIWQEELRTVAATCAKIGGQGGACSAVPTT